MNLDAAVVVNEPEFAKAVHEEADAGAGLQNHCPKLGIGCLFRIAHNSGNGRENPSWNRSGIHDALFGVTCVCMDGKPHVNCLLRMDTSTQNGGHIGLRYLLPDHRPRI